MKKRVYKIKDKILVRGNENELTEDEVLVKEENGSVVLKERVNGEVKGIVVKGNNLSKEPITVQATQAEVLGILSFQAITISLQTADYDNIINNKTAVINFELDGQLGSIDVKGIVNSSETTTFWAGTLTMNETIMMAFGDIGNNKLYVYIAA